MIYQKKNIQAAQECSLKDKTPVPKRGAEVSKPERIVVDVHEFWYGVIYLYSMLPVPLSRLEKHNKGLTLNNGIRLIFKRRTIANFADRCFFVIIVLIGLHLYNKFYLTDFFIIVKETPVNSNFCKITDLHCSFVLQTLVMKSKKLLGINEDD
jgi:hypothetical protein